MKKQILEILYADGHNPEVASSEIADMVKAFTEWKDENSAVIFIRDGKKGRWYAHNSRYFTFDNLFIYWYDNIKDK